MKIDFNKNVPRLVCQILLKVNNHIEFLNQNEIDEFCFFNINFSENQKLKMKNKKKKYRLKSII